MVMRLSARGCRSARNSWRNLLDVGSLCVEQFVVPDFVFAGSQLTLSVLKVRDCGRRISKCVSVGRESYAR